MTQPTVPHAPASVTDVLVRLADGVEAWPKRLRQCAQATRRHLHLVAVSTVSEMAAACDVAPSVYIRFCQALGFSGYSEMQALFRANLTDFRPDYEKRLASLRGEGRIATDRVLADFAEAGHKSLLSLSNTVTNDQLDRMALTLSQARVIHLLGLRRAFAVVANMAYLLDKLRVPAMLHGGTASIDSSGAVLPGDAVFAATFAPFSPETVQFAERARERGARIFGLTDSTSCPLFDCTEAMLLATEDEVAGFRGLNAAMTLTTTLAVTIRSRRAPVDSLSESALME